ncbi:MAG: rRNA maturation RNase YbeY [bacterium]
MEILIKNLYKKQKLDKKFVKKICQISLKFLKYEDKELSVVLVNAKFIKELNVKYKNTLDETDVLAFSNEGNLLGDVVICIDVCKKQALKYKHSFNQELAILLIHGILHLSGFNDQEKKEKAKMKYWEKKVLGVAKNEICDWN